MSSSSLLDKHTPTPSPKVIYIQHQAIDKNTTQNTNPLRQPDATTGRRLPGHSQYKNP
jgi:hypothetical protein